MGGVTIGQRYRCLACAKFFDRDYARLYEAYVQILIELIKHPWVELRLANGIAVWRVQTFSIVTGMLCFGFEFKFTNSDDWISASHNMTSLTPEATENRKRHKQA